MFFLKNPTKLLILKYNVLKFLSSIKKIFLQEYIPKKNE